MKIANSLTILKDLIDVKLFLSKHEEIELALVLYEIKNIPPNKITEAKSYGIGIYCIENNRVKQLIPPSSANIEAEVHKKSIWMTISDINTISQGKWAFKFFKAEQKDIESIVMPCRDDKDALSFILSLGTIIDLMSIKKIRLLLNLPKHRKINYYLEQFFISKSCRYNRKTLIDISVFEIIKNLRNRKYPVHKIKGYEKYCKIISGVEKPTIENFVLSCITKFQIALISLHKSLITGHR